MSSSQHRRPRGRLRLLLLAPVMALTGSSCASEDLPQNALDPEGPIARQLDNLWEPVFAIATVIFVLVMGLVLFVVVKFRARGDDDAPKQIHGNARAELAWTIAPALILAVVGVLTVTTVFDVDQRAEGAEVLRVEVIGHQWWWEYRYNDLGIVTANELHIPAGEPVELKLTAADVMHNFWPPKLSGKIYAIPGRNNYMQVNADEPGRYLGQCAEYCGLSHANMRLAVVAHDEAGFLEWVKAQQTSQQPPVLAGDPSLPVSTTSTTTPPLGEEAEPTEEELIAKGFTLFATKGCNGCHAIEGIEGYDGRVGPNLTHLYQRECFAGCIFDLNERNMRKWLRDPPGVKPMMPDDGIGMPDLGLAEEEITALIAYLETLK